MLVAVAICGVVSWRLGQTAPTHRHTQAGIQLMQEKKPSEAEREWQQAVRLDPNNAEAWEMLGDFYQVAQRWPAAVQAFSQVVRINPDLPNVHANLATCAFQMKDAGTAQRHAEIALQRNPDDIAALRVLSDLAAQNHEDEKRVKYLQRLAALLPQDSGILETLAEVLLMSKSDSVQARDIVERILSLNPNSDRAYRVRGTARFNEDTTAQGLASAKADFEKVLQINPGDVEAHRYLGRICLRLNQPRQAIKHFEEISRGRPYALAHFMELASAYRKAGDERGANMWAQRFSRAEQFDTRIRDLRDRLKLKSAKFDNYLEFGLLLVNAVAENSDSYQLFHFRYERGEVRPADFYLLQAVQLRPQDAKTQTAMRRLDVVFTQFLQQGLRDLKGRNLAAADENFAHAALLRPQDPRLHNALRQLLLLERSGAPGLLPPATVPGASASKP